MAAMEVNALDDVAQFLLDAAGGGVAEERLLFHFHVGNDFTGFTDLEVLGTGQVRLKSTLTDRRLLYWRVETLHTKRVRRFLTSLHSNQIWSVTPSHNSPEDDDTLIE